MSAEKEINYIASIMNSAGDGLEDVDIRTLDSEKLEGLRSEAGAAGDSGFVDVIDRVLAARGHSRVEWRRPFFVTFNYAAGSDSLWYDVQVEAVPRVGDEVMIPSDDDDEDGDTYFVKAVRWYPLHRIVRAVVILGKG